MKIESTSGMIVEIPDTEYGILLAKHGKGTKYEILNTAGRVLSHRLTLNAIREQTLSDDQKQQVESLARAIAAEEIIYTEIVDMGYGEYIIRANRGGMMPASWARLVDRARTYCADDIENVCVNDDHRNCAMADLGFYTDEDEKYSRWVSDWCKWTITAPDGWGQPKTSVEV